MASPLTPRQALARLSRADAKMSVATAMTASDLVYTETLDDQPMIYIFSKPGEGFMLVSADDAAQPLLGYSDAGGTFSAAQMPENMRWWLSQYAQEIAAATKSVAIARGDFQEKSSISPLCSTIWSQRDPYNGMCPIVDGALSVAGCVATAMAQIMKYHNWPPQGVGSNSYEWNGSTYSMDFSEATFDWNNMRDSYSGYESQKQKDAVALLMKACGYSVNMKYSPSASGSYSSDVLPALINYFDYGYEATALDRGYFSLTDWQNIVYTSLKNHCPVYYSGKTLTAGHAFVCDGYSSNGYYHFNWGWGGLSDGYFLLTALEPEMQGTGGSSGGFNYDQMVVVNAQPRSENSEPAYILFATSEVVPEYDDASRTLKIIGGFLNYASTTVKLNLGVSLTDEEGNVEYIYEDKAYTFRAGASRYYFSLTLPELQTGIYMVNPVYAKHDEDLQWRDVYTAPDNDSSFPLIVLADGTVTLSTSAVNTVAEDAVVKSVTVYGLDGSIQDAENLSHGIYVVKTITDKGVSVSKIKK